MEMFEIDETKTGNDYGIQVYTDNLIKFFKIIKLYSEYHEFPYTSHHGNTFNFLKMFNFRIDIFSCKEKLCFCFKTKYWWTKFNEFATAHNRQITFTIYEKENFIRFVEKAGFKIEDKWNDNVESCSLSILTTVNSEFKKNATSEEIKKMVELLNKFNI